MATSTRTSADLDRSVALFHALSDATRLSIIEMLRDGERCVCELQGELDAAQSRLSFHLRVLKDAGLITDRRDGRWSYYAIAPGALGEVHDLVVGMQPTKRGRALPQSPPVVVDSFFVFDASIFLDIRGEPMSELDQGKTPEVMTIDGLRATVRERYGAVAQRVAEGSTVGAACCAPAGGSSRCCGSTTESWDPITSDLYDAGQTAGLPAEALLASLGCGNPTALAALNEGETVLDLGSGGGIDVLLSAKRVGPTGKVYGLDMTDEMLALALDNKAKAGATNVEFLKGHIESIPLPSNTVDVIISNCVINLSGDKRRVLAEAFRVLRPGGRFAVSDVIVREGLPEPVKASMPLWTGCVAGALEEREFLELLAEVGFENASIEPTRIYTRDDAATLLEGTGLDPALADAVEGTIMSGFVRATKPGAVGSPKPVRQLETLGGTASATRACGCDDDCCT